MLNMTQARRNLRSTLSTVPGIPVNSLIAWENRSFKPPDVNPATLWVRETTLVASERHVASGLLQTLAQTRWDVFTPRGKGTGDAETLAKAIAEAFEPKQSLSAGGVALQLYRTERLAGRDDPGSDVWFMIPIVVYWRAYSAI